MAKVAVVTNDLQYDLVYKSQERQRAVDEGKEVFIDFLDKMRELKVPVIHMQLICEPDDPTVEKINGNIPVMKGSDGAKILDEFLHESDIILEKHKDSGFYETELDNTLRNMGIETVIITGMQTQICVQTTAADAFFRGYKIVVPSDAVVSSRMEDKKRALDWMEQYFAHITTCDDIYNHLSVHEDFERKAVAYP